MATYYKYAERDADSYVNWAQVGKGITDMLKDEVKIREDKKQAIETAFNEDMKTLQNVEQGAWQDGNAAINNFAHDMMAQQLIDNKLLKSGQMKPRDYTLRRQNYNSQTNTLLDLSKLLQENRASAMKEYEEGKMQGLGIANMSEVEAYTNFAKSKAIINPYSAVISMGIYDTQIVNGKSVPVLKQTLSANALRNAISHRPKTFDVDKATTATANGLGEDLISVYNEATTTKEGMVIKLTGTANDELLNPEFAKQIKLFNTAINDKVESYFANPYNLTSVLTENIGYSPESYTSDKNVAAKDKSKILLKTDPLTGLRTIDETGPNYAAQKKEAVDWVTGQLLSKIDAKREITTTGTIPYAPQLSAAQSLSNQEKKDAENFAENMAIALTGQDPVAIGNAIKYLANKSGKMVVRTATGITIQNTDGTNSSTYNFLEDGKVTDPKKLTKAMVAAFGSKLPEDIIVKFANKFIGTNPLETATSATGFEEPKKAEDPVVIYGEYIDKVVSDADIKGLNRGDAADVLNAKLSGLGVTVKTSFNPLTDDVYIINEDKKESPPFNIKNAGALEAIKQWIKANPSGTTSTQKTANIKALIKSGVITGGSGNRAPR